MRNVYRKILRLGALKFCKLFAQEQREEAHGLRDNSTQSLYHLQNAVAAESMIREITIERTNELYRKLNKQTTSKNV